MKDSSVSGDQLKELAREINSLRETLEQAVKDSLVEMMKQKAPNFTL